MSEGCQKSFIDERLGGYNEGPVSDLHSGPKDGMDPRKSFLFRLLDPTVLTTPGERPLECRDVLRI